MEPTQQLPPTFPPTQTPVVAVPRSEAPKNRSALWAMIGVVIGFGLPIFACVALLASTLIGLSVAGASASNNSASFASTNLPLTPQNVSGPLSGPAVAMIDISGAISRGAGDELSPFGATGGAYSTRIVPLIKAATKNPDVKTILIRVDSPGGSVVASDEIYKALKDARAAGKHVVAWMAQTAASGGVYVSMGAEHIVAHPDTFTGSVGVILSLTNLEELYDYLGIKDNTIKSGKFKDIGSASREMTADERKLLQDIIDETYENFVSIVADSRKLTKEEVKTWADGRIMTGRQALKVKLVDELGYEQDAINKAAALGGISGEPRVVIYKNQRPIDQLFGGFVSQTLEQAMTNALARWLGVSADRMNDVAAPRLEYR